MTLTQAGNEITFHFPQEGPGCFMRGNLHGDSVDVEIANNNVVHTRGTLTYNHNTHELQGFLVYPGGDKIECRFRR